MDKRYFYRPARTRVTLGGLILFGITASLASWAQDSPDIIWSQGNNSDRINAVIFSPDGNTVISGGSDRLINFWSAADGTLIRSFNSNAPAVHESSVESLAVSPDGARLASVSYQSVKLWRVADGTSQSLAGHRDWVVGSAFSPNGAWLATASFDATVRIWRGTDGAAIKTLTYGDQMRAVAFSPDSRYLASGGGDHTLYIRQTSDWSIVRQLTGHTDDIDTIAFSPDGSLVASGSYDRTVRVWDTSDGSLKYVIGNNNGTIYSLAFSPDSSLLAYTDGEGNTVRLVRTADGVVTRTYNANVDNVQTLAFSPQGTLAYGRVDRTVVLARVGASGGGGGGGGDTNDTVTLLAPPPGHTFAQGTPITISARPTASSGIAQVEFFQNGQSLAVVNASPYTFRWTGAAPGTYNISATVTDNSGGTASDNVSITVADPPADKARPTVSITFPPPNARLQSNAVTMTGRSKDNVGVSQVLVSQNGGDFVPADGTDPWSINLELAPGPNTMRVKSVDDSGNESVVLTRTITYVVSSALTVTISGNGRVTPDYTGKLLEAGKRYPLRAIPAAGNIFNGWSGDITTNVPSFNLVMPGQDTAIQANFVPNPFLPLVGTYRGLALSDPPAIEGTGYGQFTVSSSGAFSGRLYYNGVIFPISGTFLGDGSFATTLKPRGKEPLGLTLQLHTDDGTQQITGTVSNSVVVSALTADLATFNARTNPAPQAGRYTFILPANADGTGPQGTSYGTVTITSAGVVTASGKLADGVPFTQSTALAKNGSWPFFQWLSAGNEVLAGQVMVESLDTTDMDGTINWFKNPSKSRLYPAGFATQVPFVGSLYVAPPKGTPILNFTGDTNTPNAQVILIGGNLEGETDLAGTLGPNDRLTSTDRSVSATFVRPSGAINGTFVNPTTHRTTPFSGVVIQKQNIGAGFFVGTDQSGSVLIQQAPAPAAEPTQ